MIEGAEYTAMVDHAIEKFRTLSAIMPYNTEIVYVISKEVYEAMQAYEYDFWNEHARFNVRPDGTVGVYYGTRLALINEDIADNFFMPVVYSRNFRHYDVLQADDFVIFNDEDDARIFRLARLAPDAMYTDTGLTVSFVLTHTPEIAATDNAAANLWRYIPDAAMEELEEAIREVSIAVDLTTEQVIIPNNSVDGTVTLRRKNRSKEKELNPGDTKLLDEYLHSFMKGGC